MPPFSIAEFADLVSSALALEDDLLHARFAPAQNNWNKWDVGNGPNGEASGLFHFFEVQPESPITRARRNAFDLSSSQRPSASTPTSSLILPASAPSLFKLSLPESDPEEEDRSLARSLSPSFPSSSSSIPSSLAKPPVSVARNNHNTNHAGDNDKYVYNLSKSNPSSGSSPPHRPKGIKFHTAHFHHEKQKKDTKFVKGAPAGASMLLAPPASDPAILAATMSTVDLGANCLSSLGGGGGSLSASSSSTASASVKARRASATGPSLRAGLGLGFGLSGTPVESGWERNAMDAPGSTGIGRGIKGKLLPRISISGGSGAGSGQSSSVLTAPSSPISPTSPGYGQNQGQGQGQGPMNIFAKLKRQLSKSNVRPSPGSSSSNASPTGLLFPFPSSPTSNSNPNPSPINDLENAFIQHGLAPAPAPAPCPAPTKSKSKKRSLRPSRSVIFAAAAAAAASLPLPPTPTTPSSPNFNNHVRSDSASSEWELVAPPSGGAERSMSELIEADAAATVSASAAASDSDGTIGSASGRGKKRKNRRRRARKGSGSPSLPAPKMQLKLQVQPQEEGDTSPSLYSCESAPRSIFLGRQEEEDKLAPSHYHLTLQGHTQEDARSIATSTSTSTSTAGERQGGELEYAPYLPLIIQHERLQAKLRVPVPFSAVENSTMDKGSPSFRSRERKTSGRGRERKRTLSGTKTSTSTSTSASSTSTSTSAKQKLQTKRSSTRPRAPPPALAFPPPAAPPPACPPPPSKSPERASPLPRRASAPVSHPPPQSQPDAESRSRTRMRASQPHPLPQSQSHRERALSSYSSVSVSSSRASSLSRESRDSVDSRGPVTPCTPFFTASEGSSVVVAGSGSTSTSGSMRSSVDSAGLEVPVQFEEERGGVLGGVKSEMEKEKEKYNTLAQPVSPSSRSSYSNTDASAARRSLSPTNTTGTSKRLQRAASPTPLVTLTRSRSRQTLAAKANAGPASPPPSGPLPPPPPLTGGERERKERARHSTPTPSITHTELYTSRRGSLAPSTQPSNASASASASDWPLHHHPSLIGLSALSTPDSGSFYASASAPPSPVSVRGGCAVGGGGEGGRRPSLTESMSMDMYLSSSSTSSELQKLYQQGGPMTPSSDAELELEFELECSSISEYYSQDDPNLSLSRSPSLFPSTESPDQVPVTDLDLAHDRTYIQRQQRQNHLLARLRGHLPCPSNASASTCDTSKEAAAALLAANTRANAGGGSGIGGGGGRKIGVGRQQVYGGAGASASADGRKEGLDSEWTLGLGLDAAAAAAPASATHVCASGVTPDTTPVAPAAPVPSFVVAAHQQYQQQQHQGMRKAGLGANKTSLPSSTSRPSSGFLLDSADLSGSPGARERCKSESAARFRSASGGRRGNEDWTLSLPGHVPQEWAKKIADADAEVVEEKGVDSHTAANATFNGNSNIRHSAPTLGAAQGVVITVEDVDDPERLGVDPGLRMSMIRSSITSDPRVGEIVLCVPRVVSSGSGIEDVVMDKSTVRTSSLQVSEPGEESVEGNRDVEPTAEDPIVEHKERVKANAKANLAKLEALSADLARFNEMLRSSGAPSSPRHGRASMPVPARDLRHTKSCGVLEVDEPPPKNAVLRMPSVEVFMKDDGDLRSVLDMSEDEEENEEENEEEKKEGKCVERTPPQVVLSPVSKPESPDSTYASRPPVARLSATSLGSVRSTRSTTSLSSPTTPSPTTPSRMRGPLPFAPFPPPTSFAPSKARKPEAATAGMNTGNGVSGVLASGIFGSSVSVGARPLGRTKSTSPGRGAPASAPAAGPSATMTSKPVLKLQTAETSVATSTVRPSMARRSSVSSTSSSSTTSTATVATAAFPSSMLVPSPMMSPLETPMASAFPAPPPLSYPSLAAAVVGGRANSSASTSKPQKKEAERPSTTSSDTSVSSVGTDETIIPSVEQRMRMRLGLLGSGLLGSVDSDHEREGTDEESMYSGTYYSARSSFSSEAR